MMLVSTYVAPSAIEGLGAFTAVALEEGQPVWRRLPPFDHIYPRAVVDAAPPPVRAFLERYGYPCPDDPEESWIVDGDDGRFMNHSDTPNVAFDPGVRFGWALRPITAGEELTCDYGGLERGHVDIQASRHPGDVLVRAA